METEKFTHSLSQPEGMDRTPPGTPKKSGKMLAVKVQMLDDSVTMFQVQAKALGRVLFDQVCCQLHLLESDYFGLEYQEVGGPKYWLDLEKPLSRQIGLSLIDTLIKFCVKFYTPDPSQLEEEFTRYLFCLQIKRDLAQGLLQCNSNTAALMASYIVQAECGDYVVEDYPDHRYLSSYKFVPNQDQELERRIMENHKKHAGQSPAEADLNLLETARRCELYGIKMHAAKDHEGVPLNLAVAHMGIVVFQNFTKINTFSWAKIRKISFKRKRFLVKLHPEGYGYYKDTVEFFFEGRNECKNFWKKCVENHGFFRCSVVKKFPRQKTRVLSRGSSFRYSGRTQKQIVDFVRENYVKRQTFQRSQSFRHSSSAHSSVANVGTSISAHPLLPLGENAVAGTPVSLSCGSMTLTSSPLHTADIHGEGSPSPPLTTSASLGTSITSSPQHFYPQESPFHRPDHHRAKVKVPHVHSHHGISPHQSPTDAATAVTNHSASLSNNNTIFNDNSNNINNNSNVNNAINYAKIMNKDAKTSDANAESPHLTNVNDIYSNCYSTLKNWNSVFHDTELNHNEPTETDICFLNETLPANQGIEKQSVQTNIRSSTHKFPLDADVYGWDRSSSSKDAYHEENLIPGRVENDQNVKITLKKKYNDGIPFEIDCDPRAFRHDYSKRKSYSAISSQTPFGDQNVDLMSEVKIYSSSYPGTSSSLSTESVEGEPDVQISEMIDVKYDSQEEMVLSHDDVSHDSYELLEKELDYYENEPVRSKRQTAISESDRARSCSWGSDGSVLSSYDTGSTDIFNSEYQKNQEKEFWSIPREKNSKPKSETDFRVLEWKKDTFYSKGLESGTEQNNLSTKRNFTVSSKNLKERDSFYYGAEAGWEFKKKDKTSFKVRDATYKRNETKTPTFEDDKTYFKIQEGKSWVPKDDKDFERNSGGVKSKPRYEMRRINKGENEFDGFIKEKQDRFEDKRKPERKRIKKFEEETFHEKIQEEERREWEKEKRLMEKNNAEEKFRYEENSKKSLKTNANIYSDFREIQFKKFDRVVSNQFGKYSEFLTHENGYKMALKDQKRLENQDKKSKAGNLIKEQERREEMINYEDSEMLDAENIYEVVDQSFSDDLLTSNEGFLFSDQEKRSDKISLASNFNYSPKGSNKFTKTLLERTQSDSYGADKNIRRSQLLHQKSVIDLTPERSKEENSDYDNDVNDYLKKTSRSEHDIPYVLHKRQCMNGTARNIDFSALRDDLSFSDLATNTTDLKKQPVGNPLSFSRNNDTEIHKTKSREECRKQKKYLDFEKRGVQIINLDEPNEKVSAKMLDSRKNNILNLRSEPVVEKKFSAVENKIDLKNDKIKDMCKFSETLTSQDLMGIQKSNIDIKKLDNSEPLYAKVCKKKPCEKKEIKKDVLPENLKGSAKNFADEQKFDTSNVSSTQKLSSPDWDNKISPELPKRTTSQKPCAQMEGKDNVKENLVSELKDGKFRTEEKNQPAIVRGKQGSVLQRRGESLILYARTRLGLSEGSAFIPFVREGQAVLPPRRTKSLDAPYVSVHRLPPADAFSSKDDTVDGNDEVIPDVIRSEKADEAIKIDEKAFLLELNTNTESDVDSVFLKDVEEEVNFRKNVKNQSKLEISNAEKKILNGIRNKRLLSKIESVDMIDSEGDLDSSKLADASPIPLDRMVNLPESVRFPSVRQISGQTSEESADGWEPKEVKLKRRTPRRSVGREDYDGTVQESVVWDSKDDESINDEVWDDNLLGTEKFDGSGVPVPVEYLKRGSCGQSIDDDNLSTPMKESSPEHWVSVEDLPEALEREEKLLKRQEKLLREKILNEKLKRELNLDSIDLEYNYKDSLGRACDASMIPQTKFKGHSLDTYELTEKKLRELGNTKNSSLDEHILNNKFPKSCFDGRIQRSSETFEFARMDTSSNDKNIGYVQCTVVNDLTEIDQFEGSGEELEEFFVVLDENLGSDKEMGNTLWNQSNSFNRSASKEESVISVPEEFKDVDEDLFSKTSDDQVPDRGVDSLSEEKSKRKVEMEKDYFSEDKSFKGSKTENKLFEKSIEEKENLFYAKIEDLNDYSTKFVPESLAPVLSAECLKDAEEHFEPPVIADDVGSLSPYESLSRRGSDCPQRRSTSEEPDRLSPFPFCDSRRGSDDPRRLSTSEDSRKYSMSESVSEETRRRLSSTEETRRKRASLTKQCSVGEESLSDEVILEIQECSSSFEQEEKDVFETESTAVEHQKATESTIVKIHTVEDLTKSSKVIKINENKEQQFHEFELEVVDAVSNEKNSSKSENEAKEIDKMHLVPPTNERELSRETEDSVDYCEDFKDIRDAIKEKDISEGLICENDVTLVKTQNSLSPSSFEKTESSDADELRYIDEKRGSTPEIIIGRGKEAVSVSVVVVNEGLAVLNKMGRKDKDFLVEKEKSLSLPRDNIIGPGTSYENTRHTLPKISKDVMCSSQKTTKRNYLISTTNNSENILKSSLESSQESDMDKLCEVSVISQIHSQIVKRNLSDVGKRLRHSESEKLTEEALLSRTKTLEDPGKSEFVSTDLRTVDDFDPLRHKREDNKVVSKLSFEKEKTLRDFMGKEKKSPDQEKRDSGEDGSSSSSAPPHPKRELSSTWKPFILESSGSSSLEEGWLPPDDNAHFADEEETSSTSNNQQDDSCHDDVDYPTGIGYPVMNTSSAEMMVGGYNTVFGISRTLSRISERSTSEHERSDFEDDLTKPSSHSVSAEEESILSSDRQISLSSDPPSPKSNSSKIPELPDDRPLPPRPCSDLEVKSTVSEPFRDFIPPPLQEDDWPSPPSSSSILDTPVASHVETVYLEIYPEEAAKVTVPEPHNDGNSSSDENQTLQEEGEYFHLSSENISLSTTTTTTLEGTVIMSGRVKSARTGSLSEDLTLTSTSEWSSPTTLKSRKASEEFSTFEDVNSQISKSVPKIKPLKLKSPTSKVFGFFETPVSKVRSPTSQNSFFESGDNFNKNLKSHSESSSPKNHKKMFESPGKGKCYKKESKTHSRRVASPYYSNAAEIAEKSYFGRYDTGSLERTKIHSSRKCCSYYSVAKTVPDERNSSNSEEIPVPTSNTIPRASKKIKRRHKVALNLEIRDGRIVTSPKTRSYVLENSDSDRSSPKRSREKNIASNNSGTSVDIQPNNSLLSVSLPLRNGKANGDLCSVITEEEHRANGGVELIKNAGHKIPSGIHSDFVKSDQITSEDKTNSTNSFPFIQNSSEAKQTSLEVNKNIVVEIGAEPEIKKKRYNSDKGYFMLKELLSTERTYKKDLDTVNKWFHEEVSKSEGEMPDDVLNALFNLFDPLSSAHGQFLKDLEQRLTLWEGKSNTISKKEIHKVGDLLLNHFNILPLYIKYLDKHLLILERLDAAFRKNKKFERVYRDFELQRVCYLPVSSFVTKPLHRLLHYHSLLKRLIKHYGPDYFEYKDFCQALKMLEPLVENFPSILKVSENFVQLSELQRDMPSFEGLLQGGREFIRQGCLLKHSKKGFQQRMFFLFSDILVYTNRCTSPTLQFKVNGQMPLRGVMIEDSDDKIGTNYSFTIYGGNRTLLVAASSQEEKDRWLEDLFETVHNARERNDGKTLQYLSLKSCSSSDEIMNKGEEDGNANLNKNSQHRSNTTVHVCWHRNTSTSLRDHIRSYENDLSGFLLRKFKNSNGWQKLWVVFTNFCLFFYKAYLDESPLASLPLLGYTITFPSEEDEIRKDYVFKLKFKNHAYFFRAESDYTFSRWMEVISSATDKSCRKPSLEKKST